MTIDSQITVAFKPGLQASLPTLDAMKPGEILKLKILELQGDRALIDFGNFKATADIKVPVALGDELRVRVLESGRQLKLRVVDFESKSPQGTDVLSVRPTTAGLKKVQDDLRQVLSQTMTDLSAKNTLQSIANIFNLLNDHFEVITLDNTIPGLIAGIKAYLENSGFFWEKSLETALLKALDALESPTTQELAELPEVKQLLNHDLKANLLALKALLEDRQSLQNFAPRTQAALDRAIDSLLADINQQQARAGNRLESGEAFQFFSYELPLKEGEPAARLKVYYQRKKKSGSDKGFRMSLLLAMDRLGAVRTDFFLLARDLTITFFIQNDSVGHCIQENLTELQALLRGCFNQLLLKVIVSKKKIADFDREELQDTGDKLVDLLI